MGQTPVVNLCVDSLQCVYGHVYVDSRHAFYVDKRHNLYVDKRHEYNNVDKQHSFYVDKCAIYTCLYACRLSA